MIITLIISFGCSRHDHKAFEIQMMNLGWPHPTGPKWPVADFTADSCNSRDFTFPLRFCGLLGHLRLICEGYAEVLLFLQVEVGGHEVKQLLGQKFGLEGEQNGKGVSDKSLHFLSQAISNVHNFLNVMYQSSSTSIQKVFLKPKGADNEDATEQTAKYRWRPSASFRSSGPTNKGTHSLTVLANPAPLLPAQESMSCWADGKMPF